MGPSLWQTFAPVTHHIALMMHMPQGSAVAMWVIGAGVPLLMDLPLKALYNAICQ